MTDRAVADLAVVIVTFNPAPVLEAAVDALVQGTKPPDHVLIVDNASTSTASLERVERRHPSVRVLRQPANLGFCAASNLGYRAVPDTRYVLFLNPDAVVDPDFITGAVRHLDAAPDVGAIGPKLLELDEATLQPTGRIDSAGIFQAWWGRIADRGQGERDGGQYDGPPEDVPAVCGAALVARRAALEHVARDGAVFDERFFMFKEDVDLSYRLAAAGWRRVFVSDLVVHHGRGNLQIDRSSIEPWVRRRSLVNEWRLWRKPSLPRGRRAPMLVYLLAKTVAVGAGL
jgi:GT2 family glycosyltransferase